MAAGKMCVLKKEETAEWTGLFQSDLKTEQGSLIFVKRMMAVAVSTITYLRGIFPEVAYKSRYLEDLCIKVLREDCNTPGANKIVKWLMGCFDALEKQYLEIVFIGVYTKPDEANCIVESYQFNFKYSEKGPEMDILRNNGEKMQLTLENTKKASALLIRKLFLLMQNLGSLPDNVCLTMKLYYYDDITPAEYEPPGFMEADCDSLWFVGTAVHLKVGDVQTPFHTLRVRVSAEEGRLQKLHEGNHLKETKLDTERPPKGREAVTVTPKDPHEKVVDEEDLPSEDESAQFKKPTRPLAKKRAAVKTQAKKKRRI